MAKISSITLKMSLKLYTMFATPRQRLKRKIRGTGTVGLEVQERRSLISAVSVAL